MLIAVWRAVESKGGGDSSLVHVGRGADAGVVHQLSGSRSERWQGWSLAKGLLLAHDHAVGVPVRGGYCQGQGIGRTAKNEVSVLRSC